jgi:hypothetical protein
LRYGVTVWISASVDQRYEGALLTLNEPREESFQTSSKVYAEAEKSDEPIGTRMTDNAAEDAPSVAKGDVIGVLISDEHAYGRRAY